MKKFVKTLSLVACAAVVGLVIRQVCQDLSDKEELWTSVTDDISQA